MRMQAIFPAILLLTGMLSPVLSAGEAAANPQPGNIAVRQWTINRRKGGRVRGKLLLKNIGQRNIDALAISIEFHNEEAVCLKKTPWKRLKGRLPAGKTIHDSFGLSDVPEYTVLWLYVRYFMEPKAAESSQTTKLGDVKKSLTEEFDTSALESVDEVFFSIQGDKPLRYTPEALQAAVDKHTEQPPAAAEEKDAPPASQNEIDFPKLDLVTHEDGSVDLELAVVNRKQPLKAGRFHLVLKFKDGEGKVLKTVEYTTTDTIPLGEKTIRIPGQTLFGDIQSWEISYRYE